MANYKKWSNAERDFIIENCERMTDTQIAKRMCELSGELITRSMVRQQRRKLKAVKKVGRPKKQKEQLGETG